MLLLFSIMVAERLPVLERAVHLSHSACLLWTFMNLCMCASFPFGFEAGI